MAKTNFFQWLIKELEWLHGLMQGSQTVCEINKNKYLTGYKKSLQNYIWIWNTGPILLPICYTIRYMNTMHVVHCVDWLTQFFLYVESMSIILALPKAILTILPWNTWTSKCCSQHVSVFIYSVSLNSRPDELLNKFLLYIGNNKLEI